MLAATDVDHHRIGPELRQQRIIDQIACTVGQRQRIDQHAGFTEKAIQLGLAGEAAHALDVVLGARPAAYGIVQPGEGAGYALADMTEPEHANRPLAAFDRSAQFPLPCGLLLAVGIHVTGNANQVIGNVFGHLHRHAGVFQAHHRNVARQVRHSYQRVHASAQVEDGLELWLLIEQRRRRMPDDGVVRAVARAVWMPNLNLCVWNVLLNQVGPALGLGVGGNEEDFHGRSAFVLFERMPACVDWQTGHDASRGVYIA